VYPEEQEPNHSKEDNFAVEFLVSSGGRSDGHVHIRTTYDKVGFCYCLASGGRGSCPAAATQSSARARARLDRTAPLRHTMPLSKDTLERIRLSELFLTQDYAAANSYIKGKMTNHHSHRTRL